MSSKKVTVKLPSKIISNLPVSMASTNRRIPRRRSLRRQTYRPRFRPQSKTGLLAGYGGRISSRYSTMSFGDSTRVSGFDLVSSTLENYHNISYFASANPLTWIGTKIATIAKGYQNYRPLKFKIHYRPQIGSTVSYSMFIGTVWQGNVITSREAIEATLVTSPGGMYIPAWQISSTTVPLGSRLPMRMFPVRDASLTFTPFCVVCRAAEGDSSSEAVAMPGRIFIEYEYEFSNPIGSGYSSDMMVDSVIPVTLYDNIIYSGSNRSLQPGILSSTSGWLVDMNHVPTPDWPLFSHLTTDMFMGPIDSSTGSSSLIQMFNVKLDGKIPPAISNTTTPGELAIELYTNSPPEIPSLPTTQAVRSAEPFSSSSASASSQPPIDDVQLRTRSYSAPRTMFSHVVGTQKDGS